VNFSEVKYSFLATLLVIGTDLLFCGAVQGIAPVLLSATLDYGLDRLRWRVRFGLNIDVDETEHVMFQTAGSWELKCSGNQQGSAFA